MRTASFDHELSVTTCATAALLPRPSIQDATRTSSLPLVKTTNRAFCASSPTEDWNPHEVSEGSPCVYIRPTRSMPVTSSRSSWYRMCMFSSPKPMANWSPCDGRISISESTMFGEFHEDVLSGFEETIVKMEVMSCQEPPVEMSR